VAAEDAVANGVNKLPVGIHGHVFSAVSRAHSLFADVVGHNDISFKRRVALLALYHNSSPKIQPVFIQSFFFFDFYFYYFFFFFFVCLFFVLF
jgi:hypothetical protein